MARHGSIPTKIHLTLDQDMTRAKVKHVVSAIRQYSKAYRRLNKLQKDGNLIPPGDQKTGSIGEFYAHLFLKDRYRGSSIEYQREAKGYDFEVKRKGLKISVKTVSAYSESGAMSRIHGHWHELYAIRLNHQFEPIGFWIIQAKSVPKRRKPIQGCRMPQSSSPESYKSCAVPFGRNHVQKLHKLLYKHYGIRLKKISENL